METKRTLFNKRCNMLDEIRHEQSAMEDAIPHGNGTASMTR